MPSTFPGLGTRVLWPLEMLFAAFFWDPDGNVGSQGWDSASPGEAGVSGRLRSSSGGSWSVEVYLLFFGLRLNV